MNHHTQNETVMTEEKSFMNEFAMYGVGLGLVFSFVLMVTA
ncbi:hypothetical protein JOC95_003266 [Bacillus tianshenii]|uniref:Uncharacterized protein n=1 Tax=Sutcliffiella tianshenii TaxID=1463404 RepID=A0ABS2P374_9BACI|nr:hypothetical protein [Bacillus tianshenii]MBM7621393.1 hypothetical protein [Bacillus tianshenii]